VVYDCSSAGVQRQPFEVWMLDCVGAMGVKRLKPEHRPQIAGVIGYCRAKFERQVPFDYGFHPDDAALYCLELTEKAFRSQGLALSQPVKIGDWDHLTRFPLTALLIPRTTRLVLERPITLEQPVYLPGNEGQGVWGSPLLETVIGPEPNAGRDAAPGKAQGLRLRDDRELILFVVGELRRSYSELPLRWLGGLVQRLPLHNTTHAPTPGRDDRRPLTGMREAIPSSVSARGPRDRDGDDAAVATRSNPSGADPQVRGAGRVQAAAM
jgi:hypothetical protein